MNSRSHKKRKRKIVGNEIVRILNRHGGDLPLLELCQEFPELSDKKFYGCITKLDSQRRVEVYFSPQESQTGRVRLR